MKKTPFKSLLSRVSDRREFITIHLTKGDCEAIAMNLSNALQFIPIMKIQSKISKNRKTRKTRKKA